MANIYMVDDNYMSHIMGMPGPQVIKLFSCSTQLSINLSCSKMLAF